MNNLLISKEDMISGKEFTLLVDYSKTLEELIDIGHYDFSYHYHHRINLFNKTINSYSSKIGKEKIVCSLKEFDGLRFTEVINEMTKINLRPAIQTELLTFGNTYPELQKEFPIIGFGSYWQNGLNEKFGSFLYWSLKPSDFENDFYHWSCGTDSNSSGLFPRFFKTDIKQRGIYALWGDRGKENCFYLAVKDPDISFEKHSMKDETIHQSGGLLRDL